MSHLPLSRRAVTRSLAFLPAISVAPATLAAINKIHPDAAIIEAWDNFRKARKGYCTCPDVGPYINGENAEQRAFGKAMDEAGEYIRSAQAVTPRGAEIQLWLALTDTLLTWAEDVEAAQREDIDAAAEASDDRAIVAAIRSLRAMGALS